MWMMLNGHGTPTCCLPARYSLRPSPAGEQVLGLLYKSLWRHACLHHVIVIGRHSCLPAAAGACFATSCSTCTHAPSRRGMLA